MADVDYERRDAGASAWVLPRIVGMSRAQERVCTGQVVDAAEALAAGLVRSVHPPTGCWTPRSNWSRVSPAPRRCPSRSAAACSGTPLAPRAGSERAHRLDSRATVLRGRSADAAEGIRAFLDRREPRFPLRVSDGLPPVFGW